MMNLFEGVRKMTDDEIRMQIALFRNVTLLNAAKETSGKVLGGLARHCQRICGKLQQKNAV